MLTPRIAVAALAVTALLPACGNSAAPAPQATTSAAASATSAPAAAPSPLEADLATLAAGCTWTAEGVNYCDAVEAFSKKLGPASDARRVTVRECFGLLHHAELAKPAATCAANYTEKGQVDELLSALDKATDDVVRVELARGVDRLHAAEGAPAAHAIQIIRALAPKSSERRVVIHLLSALSPGDENKDLSPEAYALAVEIFKAPDRAPLQAAAANLLESSTSHLPEICKLFSDLVETSKDDWLWAASLLGDHKACEGELGRVFPTLLKKLASTNEGKGVADGTELDRLLTLDGQYPLSAPQKKSLVAAIDALAKGTESDREKRMIKALHEHFTK
jgi:hypothetical protein